MELKKLKANLKFAISEIYLMLKKIENYQDLNYTGKSIHRIFDYPKILGFRKICKKHDKILVRQSGSDYMNEVIIKTGFWMDQNVKRQILV